MSREKKRVHVHVPAFVKERLKDDEKTQTEVVTEALQMYYGIEDGDGQDVLKKQLERAEAKKQEARKKKHEAEQELEEAEERIENLQKSLSDFQAAVGTYEEQLEDLVEWHAEGNEGDSERRVFEDHPRVKDLARDFDKPQKAILEDLKERSDMPEELFEKGVAAGRRGRRGGRR